MRLGESKSCLQGGFNTIASSACLELHYVPAHYSIVDTVEVEATSQAQQCRPLQPRGTSVSRYTVEGEE